MKYGGSNSLEGTLCQFAGSETYLLQCWARSSNFQPRTWMVSLKFSDWAICYQPLSASFSQFQPLSATFSHFQPPFNQLEPPSTPSATLFVRHSPRCVRPVPLRFVKFQNATQQRPRLGSAFKVASVTGYFGQKVAEVAQSDTVAKVA